MEMNNAKQPNTEMKSKTGQGGANNSSLYKRHSMKLTEVKTTLEYFERSMRVDSNVEARAFTY